jgi:hypothetical protein
MARAMQDRAKRVQRRRGNNSTELSEIGGRQLLRSRGAQKYDQAKADFINAQLRRESGAAIAQSEFSNADKQYFPVPGDTPDVDQAEGRKPARRG